MDLEFDLDTLRIKDLGEEEGAYNSVPKPSIYEGLKKTSTIVDKDTGEINRPSDPTEGVNIGKIKGATSTSKIRDMLANLNSEKD